MFSFAGCPFMSDNWNFNASNPCLRVGGNYNQNGNHGMFYVNQNSTSNSNDNISCRSLPMPSCGEPPLFRIETRTPLGDN